MLDPWPIMRVLILLGVANGAPVFATRLLKDNFSAPIDAGIRLTDGQPLFGASKTIRGFAVSLTATAVATALFGLNWYTGVMFAAASLGGDLLSSFLKRRLQFNIHARAIWLDQIPEALLPILIFRAELDLTAIDIVVTVVAFIILALVLSRLLFMLNIRDRPY